MSLDNRQMAALIFAGYLVAAFFASRLVGVVWRIVLEKTAGRFRSALAQELFRPTEKPVRVTVIIYVIRTGFIEAQKKLGLDLVGAWEYVDGFLYTLIVGAFSYLAYAVVGAVMDWYLKEMASKTESNVDDQFVPVINTSVKAIVIFVAVTMVLSRFRVDIRALLGTAGIASLAVAFAAQETLANMISGFTILVDRPFRVGDRIELDSGQIGDVFEIGLRSTKILSFDNTLLVVPNKDIAGAKVVNHSYPSPVVKVKPQIGVAYGSDMDKVFRVIMEVCKAHPKVLPDPEPSAFFTSFGDSALNILVICWIADYRDKFQVLHDLNMAFKKQFEAEGISIPFPHRTVFLHTVD